MRRWGWIMSCVALILLLVFAGPPLYRHVRLLRSVQLAERSFAEKRYEAAGFFALQAWQIDPRNDTALGILSKVSREMNSTKALYWTGLWAERDPKDPTRQLDFAQAVLGSGQLNASGQLLEIAAKLPDVDQRRLAELRGALEVARRNPEDAEKIFRQMTVDFPGQARPIFNLANVLLVSPSPEKRAEGKKLLLELWEKKEMPLEVSRSLVQLELAGREGNPAAPWVEFLGTAADATLADHLAAGDAILQLQPELPESWFERTEALCKTAGDAYIVSTWLRTHGKAARALEFLNSRKTEIALPVILVAKAEVLADLGRWRELEDQLIKQNWETLESFRFAYLQEGYLKEFPNDRRSPVRQSMWKSMMSALTRTPGDYFKLSQLLESWKWPASEQEELLAELTSSKTLSESVLFAMVREAQRRENTLAALYIAQAMLRLRPEDLVVRNNVAMFRMLLQKNEPEAFSIAEELLKEFPGNAAVVTTQAFALYRQSKFKEALALMDTLPKEDLADPAKALYYGLILKALGKPADAEPYLEKAKSAQLLPEERLLLFKNS